MELTATMRSVARKPMIYLMLLNGAVLSIIVTVLLQKHLKCNIITQKQDNQGDSPRSFLNNLNNESLASKLTALNPSPTKEDARPHQTYLMSRTRCTQKLFLLIMVMTGPANLDRRTVIRKTWAIDPSMNIRWKTVFLVGQSAGNNIQNEYLKAEGMIHRDLIRGTQNEHYYNLTLKTQMGLEWAAKYCEFHFLLKADDDVFVNPYKLMDYLRKPDTPKTKLYTGRVIRSGPPHRQGRWGVSWKEYNKTTFPELCAGPAYLLSSDVVHKVVELFDGNRKPLKLEDVYVGTLVERIEGVKAVRHPWFRLLEYGHCTHSSDTCAYHPASVKCIEELFNAAMKERVEHELRELRSTKTTGRNNSEH